MMSSSNCELDQAKDLVCLFECSKHVHRALDRLVRTVFLFGTWFASSRRNVAVVRLDVIGSGFDI